MEAQRDGNGNGNGSAVPGVVPTKELDEIDSRSGSDHLDGLSADDLEPPSGNPRKRKKRYHRHTPHQIQELEA